MAKKKDDDTVPNIDELKQLQAEQQDEFPLDGAKLDEVNTEPPIPDRLSPEWSEFLMTQLHDSEIVRKKEERGGRQIENIYPRVHGLRRLVQIFVGKIVSSIANPLQHSEITTNESKMPGFTPSTCLYTIVFQPHGTVAVNDRITYSDVGDCFWYDEGWANTDRDFGVYPGPISATRAEARCLRKALGLVTCSAEELGPRKQSKQVQQEKMVDPDVEVKVLMDATQLDFINRNCERLNIHPWKFVKSFKPFKTLKEVTYIDAQALCKIIGSLLKDKGKDSLKDYMKERQVTLTNYVKNWMEEIN
jgi:hypothetical protein